MTDKSLKDKLIGFRQMEAEATQAGLRATSPELRQQYEELARSWGQLIDEIEKANFLG